MKIRRPPPKSPAENVLPMINVVFLLLIFFMLAGALRQADIYAIEPVRSHSGNAAEPVVRVLLIDREGRLALDNEPLDEAGLRRRIANLQTDGVRLNLRLKADGRVPAPRVVALMELLRDAGVERLVLLTTGEAG